MSELKNSLKIKKGDFVTVIKWINKTDWSYIGDVFKVELVESPFVILSRNKGPMSGYNLTLNTTEVELQILSDEFVNLTNLAPKS